MLINLIWYIQDENYSLKLYSYLLTIFSKQNAQEKL